jgi:hypothetical protein
MARMEINVGLTDHAALDKIAALMVGGFLTPSEFVREVMIAGSGETGLQNCSCLSCL